MAAAAAPMIPVWWVARHGGMARGYGDQGMLEQILCRTAWTPADAVGFDHVELRGDDPWPDAPGAVVVVNGYAHLSDAQWFADRVNALDWALVVVSGDENYRFDHRLIRLDDRHRLWLCQPWPQNAADADGLLPGGPYPGCREELVKWGGDSRPYDVFFAGQANHVRRQEAVKSIRALPPRVRCYVQETAGFMQGLSNADYMGMLAQSKIVPSPSGPVTPDSSRPLSAMEAGCVPIVDARPSRGEPFDYWRIVFGAHPIPCIAEWADLGPVADAVLSDWAAYSNQVFAWWQHWKIDVSRRFERDVRRLAGIPAVPTSCDTDVTVVVTTSPVPGHPAIDDLRTVIESVRAQFPLAPIVLVCDGVRPEQRSQTVVYQHYVRRVLWECNFVWHNVLPVVLADWGHQANATRKALEYVETSTILFVEHDTPLVGQIDWDGIYHMVASKRANAVRLHQDDSIHPDHAGVMLDSKTRIVEISSRQEHWEVPARRTMVWWQRPHLASAAFYRHMLDTFIPESSRTMIEDAVYATIWHDHLADPEQAHLRWKLWVYAPEDSGDGLGMRRSGHLDSRKDQPKYDMRFT